MQRKKERKKENVLPVHPKLPKHIFPENVQNQYPGIHDTQINICIQLCVNFDWFLTLVLIDLFDQYFD